jgi:hypothetical protein
MTGSSDGCRRDIDRRVRCQHVIGHQRGVAVRIGGCGMRTVADGDRMQHASIGSNRAGLSDSMDCLALLCSATARAAAAEVHELRDKLEVERSMLSEIRDRSDTRHRMARVTTLADLRCRSGAPSSWSLDFRRLPVHTPYGYRWPDLYGPPRYSQVDGTKNYTTGGEARREPRDIERDTPPEPDPRLLYTRVRFRNARAGDPFNPFPATEIPNGGRRVRPAVESAPGVPRTRRLPGTLGA